MTIHQLAERVSKLERQVAELQREVRPLRPYPKVQDTFGLFADDPEFDEIVRLGREYRDRANAEGE